MKLPKSASADSNYSSAAELYKTSIESERWHSSLNAELLVEKKATIRLFSKTEIALHPTERSMGTEVSAIETSHTFGKWFVKQVKFFPVCTQHMPAWQDTASHNSWAELAVGGSGLAFPILILCQKAELSQSFQSMLHVVPQHGTKPDHCYWAPLLWGIYISTQKLLDIYKSRETRRKKINPWIRPILQCLLI